MRHFILSLLLFLFCALSFAQVKYARVTAKLYNGPESWYSCIGYVKKGTKVRIQKTTNGWSLITYFNTIGYVQSSLLTNSIPKSVKSQISSPVNSKSLKEEIKAKLSARNKKTLYEDVDTSKDEVLSINDIYRLYNDAVFIIYASKPGGQIYQGSGFFINNTGLAVADKCMFDDTENVIIQIPSTEKKYIVSKIISRISNPDVIIFQTNKENSQFIPLSPIKPFIGETVYTIEARQGFTNSYTTNEISCWKDSNMLELGKNFETLCGGCPVIDPHGNVVGISSSIYESLFGSNCVWSTLPIANCLGITPQKNNTVHHNRSLESVL